MSNGYLRVPADKPWDQMSEAEQKTIRDQVTAHAESIGIELRPADHPVASPKQLTPGAYWLMWSGVERE